MYNYNFIYCKCYYCVNIDQKKVALRIMNLALMKFSLLPCGIKHTSFIFSPNLRIYKLTNSMAYGTRRSNAAFTRALRMIPILSRINPITRIDTYLYKVHFNIVLPSTPRPPQRCLFNIFAAKLHAVVTGTHG